MNDLITLQPITVPSTWNYEDSVKKTKQLAFNWKNLTKELFDELFVAREILSKEGRPETGTIVPVKTWDGYCQDVGLEKRTCKTFRNLAVSNNSFFVGVKKSLSFKFF